MRNWSHNRLYRYSCCCSSSSFCWGDLFKKAYGSVNSNRIGMKFGRNVLHVLKYASIDESDFRFDATLSRWRPWRHFKEKRKLLPRGEGTRSVDSSWSVVYSYLFRPGTDLISLLVVVLVGTTSSKTLTAPSFQIGSGWNLVEMFFE